MSNEKCQKNSMSTHKMNYPAAEQRGIYKVIKRRKRRGINSHPPLADSNAVYTSEDTPLEKDTSLIVL
jgi:hypothetical protein